MKWIISMKFISTMLNSRLYAEEEETLQLCSIKKNERIEGFDNNLVQLIEIPI